MQFKNLALLTLASITTAAPQSGGLALLGFAKVKDGDKFILHSTASGSYVHNLELQAGKGGLFLSAKRKTPGCASAPAILHLKGGKLFLDGTSDEPQEIWVDKSGKVGYNQSASKPPASAKESKFEIKQAAVVFNGKTPVACPPADKKFLESPWKVWWTGHPAGQEGCVSVSLRPVLASKPIKKCKYD